VGRPRDFDFDDALDRAVELFWKQGYAATSVRQLCDALGIQPGSFYAAFESKEACFRRAIDRYVETQPFPRTLGPDAIRLWFDVIVDPKRTPKGCLLVQSAMEHPMLDDESRTLVLDRLARVEQIFARCLNGRASAKDDAASLAATVLAIHVLARTGARPKKLRLLADRALDAAHIEARPARLARS
jgi:TetR/AcrR family transcriptional regulator, transcriptional repressor for nem operon